MTTSELFLLGALVVNFLGTMMAIFRSQLKTESRITRVETLVSMLVREMKPKNVHLRAGDHADFGV